jgi:hypothetical protein
MPEYNCYAVWDDDGPDNLDSAQLPISPELKARISSWEAAYDATLHRADPVASGFKSGEEETRFDLEGREIYRLLVDQLGPEYRVQYISVLSASIEKP